MLQVLRCVSWSQFKDKIFELFLFYFCSLWPWSKINDCCDSEALNTSSSRLFLAQTKSIMRKWWQLLSDMLTIMSAPPRVCQWCCTREGESVQDAVLCCERIVWWLTAALNLHTQLPQRTEEMFSLLIVVFFSSFSHPRSLFLTQTWRKSFSGWAGGKERERGVRGQTVVWRGRQLQ